LIFGLALKIIFNFNRNYMKNKYLIKFAEEADTEKKFLDNPKVRDTTFTLAGALTAGSLAAYIAAARENKKKDKIKAALKWGLGSALVGGLAGMGASKAVGITKEINDIRNDKSMTKLISLALDNMTSKNGKPPLIPSNMLIRGILHAMKPIAYVGDTVTEGIDYVGNLFKSDKNEDKLNKESLLENPYVLSISGAAASGSLGAYIASAKAKKKDKIKAALKWGLGSALVGGLAGLGGSKIMKQLNEKSLTKPESDSSIVASFVKTITDPLNNSNGTRNLVGRIVDDVNDLVKNTGKVIVDNTSKAIDTVGDTASSIGGTIVDVGTAPIRYLDSESASEKFRKAQESGELQTPIPLNKL
jgi:hypothetical protein